MNWKKVIPTTPGLYWVYANDNKPPDIWAIDKNGWVLSIGNEVPECYLSPRWVLKTTNAERIKEISDYYFLGPIEIPETPKED